MSGVTCMGIIFPVGNPTKTKSKTKHKILPVLIRQKLEQIHTQWIAGLDHELFDDTVKYVTIVITISTVNDEILHCLRAPKDKKG